VVQYIHPGESATEHAAFLARCSGYSDRIKKKLCRLPMFTELNQDEIEQTSDVLGEVEPFRQRYFSNLIEVTSMKIIGEVEREQSRAGGASRKDFGKHSHMRFEQLLDVKMQLLLRASSQQRSWLRFLSSTPLHCALQVGDFVFEWNESSLIIPVDVSSAHDEPVLFSPIQERSEWFAKVQSDKRKIHESIVKNDYEMQIGLHFKWTEEKERVILSFIKKVIHYNRHNTYHGRTCNSQRFVNEAMGALGIKTPPKLSSTIKEHVNELSKKIARQDLKGISSHDDLDVTVNSNLSSLSKLDVEYLMAHYLLFHMDDYERRKQSDKKWECPFVNCKLSDLEGKLSKLSKSHMS